MLLTLDNDFLGPVDELVPTLLGEIFLSQILSTSIKPLPSTILLVPRYAFSDIVLREELISFRNWTVNEFRLPEWHALAP